MFPNFAKNVQQLGYGIVLALTIGTFYSINGFPQMVRSGYSEMCNQTVKCRSDAWLSCDETASGVCRCIKPDEMVYDETRGKCVVLVGERCKLGFESAGKGSFWYEKSECASGAVCGPSGTCSCSPGTFEFQEANQTVCQPVKGIGRSCAQSIECDVNKFLSCVDGTCICDPNSAIYNPKSFSVYDGRGGSDYIAGDICIGRVGSACSYGSGKYCVRNAVCSGGGGADSSTCQCSSTFTVTSELLCGLEYNGNCGSGGSVCSDQFICTGETVPGYNVGRGYSVNMHSQCKCPNPAFQEFDSSSKTCRGREGSPCNPRQMNSCTKRASCVERDKQFYCECDKGYVVTKNGKCQRGFGTSCHSGPDGVPVPTEELCDEAASLKCIDGSCRCPNLVDVYEDGRRSCVFPVGVTCREKSECVENAVCESHTGGKGFSGRCACEKGYRVVSNRTTCKPEFLHEDDTTDRN